MFSLFLPDSALQILHLTAFIGLGACNLCLFPSCSLFENAVSFDPIEVLALVIVAILECFLPFSVLKVPFELPFVNLAIDLMPFAASFSQACLEVAFITAAIFPNVFALAIRLSTRVLPNVLIAVNKLLFPQAVFEEMSKLALISAIFMFENSFPVLPI